MSLTTYPEDTRWRFISPRGTEKVGTLSRQQVRQIAQAKMRDLNANDIEAAMKIVEGTARSMGVTTD